MSRPRTLAPALADVRQLAGRMVDLLIERDGVRDVQRRLEAVVKDLERRKSAGDWSKKEAS